MMAKPRIFVGSSREGLEVTYAIQENLEYDAEVTVWTQGIFSPGVTAIQNLIAALKSFDFAIFAFLPEDALRLRGEEFAAVRDNVVFELGLFMGRLGMDRCFFVLSRGGERLRLPTDLLGVTSLDFDGRRSDGNLVAALGPACNKVRRELRVFAAGHPAVKSAPKLEEMIAAWESPPLLQARETVRKGVSLSSYDEPTGRAEMRMLFAFFESLADSVLAGQIDTAAASEVFRKPLLAFWEAAHTALAPPNQADEFWQPEPQISVLYRRWK